MRPIKLKVSGLNSYIESQEIDFSKLTERGLFGIFGPTGSGKSTILDAITLSLYGSITRMPKNKNDYVNTQTNQTSISFEFELGKGEKRKRYRVDRNMKVNDKGYLKTTLARLIEIKDDEIEVITEGSSQIPKEIESMLGLNLTDFTRSVVLPQGKFNEFLQLTGVNRREMLERIFNLQEFGEDLMNKVKRKKAREFVKIGNIQEALKQYDGINKENLKILNDNQNILIKEEESIRKNKNTYEKQFTEAEKVYNLQIELNAYNKAIENLSVDKQIIEDKRLKVEKGYKVLKVKPLIKAYEDIEDELKKNNENLNDKSELLEKEEKELEVIKESYDAYKKRKEDEYPNLVIKKNNLERAVKLSEKLLYLNKEITNKNREIANETKELDNFKKLLKDEKEAVENVKKEQENIEIRIKDISINREYRDNLNAAHQLGVDMHKEMKRDKELDTKINDSNEDKKEKENKFKLLTEKEDNITKSLDELIIKLEELNKNIPGDSNSLIKESDNLSALRDTFRITKDGVEAKKELLNNISKVNKCINNKNDEIKEITKLLNDKNKVLEDLKEESEKYSLNNYAKALREKLNVNEPCLVCGSTNHDMEKVDLVIKDSVEGIEIQYKITSIEKDILKINDELTKLNVELAGLNKEKDFYDKGLDKYENIDVTINIDELDNKVKEGENNLKLLKEKIDAFNKNKTELEEKIKDLVEEKGRISTNVKVVKTELSHIENVINGFKEEKEKIKEYLDENIISINKYLNILKVSSINDKYKEVQKNDEEIELKNKYLEELKAKLNKATQKVEEMNLKVNNLDKNIDKLITEKESLEKEFKQNKTELDEISEGKNPVAYLEEIKKSIEDIVNNEKLLGEKVEIKKETIKNIQSKINVIKNDLDRLKKLLPKVKEDRDIALKENEFSSVAEINLYEIDKDKLTKIEEEVKVYDEETAKVIALIESTLEKLNGRSIEESAFNRIKQELEILNKSLENKKEEIGAINNEIANMKKKLVLVDELNKEYEKVGKKYDLLEQLMSSLSANKFVEFIATTQLKYISKEASKRLKEITKGRYALEIDSEGNFIMRDDFNGGTRRSTDTLSGGETFLTSLALALALSSHIQLKGSAPLEFFFLDEGFGSLDSKLLDLVVNSLEKLHNDKLSVGIITHVEELKERIPVKLVIEPAEAGGIGSKVKIEYS